MAELTDVSSAKVKAVRRLRKRAFREQDRAFLAEGAQAVREALGGQPMSKEMGLTYRRQLRDNLTGMLAYWRSTRGKTPAAART